MDRRTIIKTKMADLKNNFQPFLAESAKRGYPIKQMRFREMFPGDITTPIVADILIDWRNGRGFAESATIVREILEEIVPEEERKDFNTFLASDTDELFNYLERPEPYIQLLAG